MHVTNLICKLPTVNSSNEEDVFELQISPSRVCMQPCKTQMSVCTGEQQVKLIVYHKSGSRGPGVSTPHLVPTVKDYILKKCVKLADLCGKYCHKMIFPGPPPPRFKFSGSTLVSRSSCLSPGIRVVQVQVLIPHCIH